MNKDDKEAIRLMAENTISSAQDSLQYAGEMFHAATSCLDTPRINGTIEYLEVSKRRTKDTIKLLKKWRKL